MQDLNTLRNLKMQDFFMNILAFIHIFHDKFLYEPYYQTPTRHFSFV